MQNRKYSRLFIETLKDKKKTHTIKQLAKNYGMTEKQICYVLYDAIPPVEENDSIEIPEIEPKPEISIDTYELLSEINEPKKKPRTFFQWLFRR